ncbi:MAG: DUF1697 domain-containing protein [Bacillota bacterium]
MKEATYCAFLRGVNVNGRTMKMAEVCGVFEGAGMKAVSSVLASGNIIFRSDRPVDQLRGALERAMSDHFGSQVSLFVKSAGEIAELLSAVPFAPDPGLHIYAYVCEAGFETVLMEKFREIAPLPNERAAISGGLFFWQVDKGATLDAGFSKILGHKSMRDKFTSRNIGTIQKIRDKIRAAGVAK